MQRAAGLARLGQRQDLARGQFLAGFPAREGVGVMGREQGQLGVGPVVLDDHRRGKVAQQRRHGRLGDAVEGPLLALRGQLQQRGIRHLAVVLERQGAALGVKQPDSEGDVVRRLDVVRASLLFDADGRAFLAQRDRAALRGGVVFQPDRHARRAGLTVPAAEHRQVAAGMLAHVDRFHGGDEVVAGHGLAVMAAEVLIHAGAKARLAQQRVLHADDLGALFVHGGGVEVADLLVAFRADRVGHGTGVFGELGGAQRHHVVDALDRAGAGGGGLVHALRHHVGAEFLVAEDGQAFLQAELEPVAAGDAVAGPVMEILVADDRFDAFIVGVGGGLGVGQHIGRVEDVQALVLHRPHVEVVHGHDHEAVQVQLQSEAGLVPAQRAHQRIQGPFGLVFRAGIAVDLQQHVAAAGGAHGGFAVRELARDQREQVAGLGEGSSHSTSLRPSASWREASRLPLDSSTG